MAGAFYTSTEHMQAHEHVDLRTESFGVAFLNRSPGLPVIEFHTKFCAIDSDYKK